MKNIIFHTLFAFCLVVSVCVISAEAQGIGTVEYYMKYGREYLEAGKYDMAIMYFEDAVKKDPNHAEANFLIGACYFKLGKPEKARPFLERAARLDSDFQEDAEGILAEIGGATEKEIEKPAKPTSKNTRTGEETVEYEVGDAVEVSYAGQWNPGVITKVEGRGESVRAEVDYTFQGEKRTAKFFYNALRRASANSKPEAENASKSSSGLTLGEYTCSLKEQNGTQWVFRPRGSFKLFANGKYTQTNSGGSYKYDGAKTITFTGGFFASAKGKVIGSEQIDIEFSDSYWWTCALQ